jgi:FKBP-type peptidyl-prolyl cis-trans isomerase
MPAIKIRESLKESLMSMKILMNLRINKIQTVKSKFWAMTPINVKVTRVLEIMIQIKMKNNKKKRKKNSNFKSQKQSNYKEDNANKYHLKTRNSNLKVKIWLKMTLMSQVKIVSLMYQRTYLINYTVQTVLLANR